MQVSSISNVTATSGAEQRHTGGSAVPRLILGMRLRQLREACGITRAQAAWEIRASEAKMSRLERGRVRCKPRDVADLLTLYGITSAEERATLLALAEQANTRAWWQAYSEVVPPWFETYLGMEQSATVIRAFEVQFVPGLLQTPDYARSVIRLGQCRGPVTEQQVTRRTELRLRRQLMLSSPRPPRLWTVIDEAALHRPIGGPAALRGQLRHLIEMSEQPHITVQVLPLRAGGHAAAGGPVSILRLPAEALPDVVYLEQLSSALYPSRDEEIESYQHLMNRLGLQAEEPRRSRDVLFELLRDL